MLLCWWVGVFGDARVHRDDEAVRPTSFGLVFADKPGERVRELTHERGAI